MSFIINRIRLALYGILIAIIGIISPKICIAILINSVKETYLDENW